MCPQTGKHAHAGVPAHVRRMSGGTSNIHGVRECAINIPSPPKRSNDWARPCTIYKPPTKRSPCSAMLTAVHPKLQSTTGTPEIRAAIGNASFRRCRGRRPVLNVALPLPLKILNLCSCTGRHDAIRANYASSLCAWRPGRARKPISSPRRTACARRRDTSRDTRAIAPHTGARRSLGGGRGMAAKRDALPARHQPSSDAVAPENAEDAGDHSPPLRVARAASGAATEDGFNPAQRPAVAGAKASPPGGATTPLPKNPPRPAQHAP